MKYFDTSFPNIFSKYMYEEKNADIGAEYTDKVVDVCFSASATYLNAVKNKEKPAVLRFDSVNGQMAGAAIIQYIPNSDDKKPGNWSLTFTLDQKDVPADAMVRTINDPQVHPYFRSISGEKYHFGYKFPDTLTNLNIGVFEVLRKWLDENAKEKEEVTIELDNIFTARVAVEGGEKVMAIEPAGEIKMLIKDDAAIEK